MPTKSKGRDPWPVRQVISMHFGRQLKTLQATAPRRTMDQLNGNSNNVIAGNVPFWRLYLSLVVRRDSGWETPCLLQCNSLTPPEVLFEEVCCCWMPLAL